MSDAPRDTSETHRGYETWGLHQAVNAKTVGILLLAAVFVVFTGRSTDMDKAASETGQAVLALAGIGESTVLDGAVNFLRDAFPFVLESRIETDRLDDFDPENLPLFTHLETVQEQDYDTLTDTYTSTTSEYLVHPFGYLRKVLGKMWETLEMGFWGTLLSVLISIPLGTLGARSYSPNLAVYGAARAILGFHRAMPELIIALFFVLMYGFGPVAGILALAVHTSGVLGKFFADEIENAPPGPQQALKAGGANSIQVLRMSVFPHVFPSYMAYVQYIFERNIRTATVLGIVGAGGIGMELKGRWDIFDYGHVSTILLVIFATVMLLELVTQRLRTKAM